MSWNTGRYSFLPLLDVKDGILGLYRAVSMVRPEAAASTDRRRIRTVCGNPGSRPRRDDHRVVDIRARTTDETARLWPPCCWPREPVYLQQVSVRAAPFNLITSLELMMADWIETQWFDDPESWLASRRQPARSSTELCASERNDRGAKVHRHAYTAQIAPKQLPAERKGK